MILILHIVDIKYQQRLALPSNVNVVVVVRILKAYILAEKPIYFIKEFDLNRFT